MNVTAGPLEGLLIIEPRVFSDDRGYFFEAYQQARYQAAGIPTLIQDNTSLSKRNVIRGLHYQLPPHAQGKLVGVTMGAVWDVAVDIRVSSPTFGQWFGIELSDKNHKQLYIPPGFAHGFCVLSDEAQFYYKCTDVYAPNCEGGILWNDPKLNIPWPVTQPILSPKDEIYSSLETIAHDKLFT